MMRRVYPDAWEPILAHMRAHYSRQGATAEANSVVTEQRHREAKTARDNPSYFYGELMEHDAGRQYRTGDFGNMTVNDVRRLRRDYTGNTNIPILATPCCTEIRPASPYRVLAYAHPTQRNTPEFSGTKQLVQHGRVETVAKVEHSETSLRHCLRNIWRGWFPSDKIVVAPRRCTPIPLSAIAMVLIFCVILIVPITLSVVMHETSGEIAEMQEDLRAMQTIADDLQIKLDDKNDLELIEDIAINKYGMIKLDDSNSKFLRLNGMDMIERFDTNSDNKIVLALLNALGIQISPNP